jgi:hypothetical protein
MKVYKIKGLVFLKPNLRKTLKYRFLQQNKPTKYQTKNRNSKIDLLFWKLD